jgi:hypothetical protein
MKYIDMSECKCDHCREFGHKDKILVSEWENDRIIGQYLTNSLCIVEDNHDNVIIITEVISKDEFIRLSREGC